MTNREAANQIASKITGETVNASTTKGALEAISGKKVGSIAQAINDIAQGDIPSGNVTVEALNVTENGTYTAPEGKAYSPVSVTVAGSLPDNIYFYGVTTDSSGYAGNCSMVSSEEITGVGTYDVYFYENAVSGGYQLAAANATEKISITIDEVIEGPCGYSPGRFTYNNTTYYLCLGNK